MIWPARAKDQTPDLTGRPDEPWWTRQAITWMDKYLASDMKVIEWGAGASTPWLAARCGRLRTIENKPGYRNLAMQALKEAGFPAEKYYVELHPLDRTYYECIEETCDAAVIDGRLRVLCCRRAAQVLAPGGILLLDNAERSEYAEARNMLQTWPVVETSNGLWHTNIWIKPNAE